MRFLIIVKHTYKSLRVFPEVSLKRERLSTFNVDDSMGLGPRLNKKGKKGAEH